MVWSHDDQWLLSSDQGGFVKYWQTNMNNVKMYQAHKEAVRGLRLVGPATYAPGWPFCSWVFCVTGRCLDLIAVICSKFREQICEGSTQWLMDFSLILSECKIICLKSDVFTAICVPNKNIHFLCLFAWKVCNKYMSVWFVNKKIALSFIISFNKILCTEKCVFPSFPKYNFIKQHKTSINAIHLKLFIFFP